MTRFESSGHNLKDVPSRASTNAHDYKIAILLGKMRLALRHTVASDPTLTEGQDYQQFKSAKSFLKDPNASVSMAKMDNLSLYLQGFD